MTDPATQEIITAGLVVIGDEILSGRTKDTNTGTIADFLTARGIDLREVRVVSDRTEAIVEAVNALRAAYALVFTTGGIGPTHDDITADAVAAAFGVSLREDPRAVAMLSDRYGEAALTPARLRMARIPEGAALIANPISAAPGFVIGNVHVMAGVPAIMKVMLAELGATLPVGLHVGMRTIPVLAGEGAFAEPLAEVQHRFPEVAIGSYPKVSGKGFRADIVLRSRNAAKLADAAAAVEAMLAGLAVEIESDPDAEAAP